MAQEGGNKGLNRSLQNTGTVGRFAKFLTYKSEMIGKKVIEISEKNTTKECCICGKKENRSLYERTINCDCGNNMDRDKNSAVNIMNRFLSQERSVDEQSLFVRGLLRQTGSEYAHKPMSEHSQEATSKIYDFGGGSSHTCRPSSCSK